MTRKETQLKARFSLINCISFKQHNLLYWTYIFKTVVNSWHFLHIYEYCTILAVESAIAIKTANVDTWYQFSCVAILSLSPPPKNYAIIWLVSWIYSSLRRWFVEKMKWFDLGTERNRIWNHALSSGRRDGVFFSLLLIKLIHPRVTPTVFW